MFTVFVLEQGGIATEEVCDGEMRQKLRLREKPAMPEVRGGEGRVKKTQINKKNCYEWNSMSYLDIILFFDNVINSLLVRIHIINPLLRYVVTIFLIVFHGDSHLHLKGPIY